MSAVRLFRRVAIGSLGASLITSLAVAQPAPSPPTSAPPAQAAAPASTTPPPPAPRTAEEHFTLGNSLYAQSNFADAAREFQLAYDLSTSAEMLYNLGRALEESAQLVAALDAYRRFEAAMPPTFDRRALRERIASLENRVRGAARPPPPRVPTPAEAAPSRPPLIDVPPPRTGPPAGALVLMVGGGAALITGAVLGAVASASLSDCRVDGDVASCPNAAALERARQAPTFATAANVSFVVGALALAAGGAWWVFAPTRRSTLAVGPATLSFSARW